MWSDTDRATWKLKPPYLNLNPDIIVWGRDVETNKAVLTKNISSSDSKLSGKCYFHFLSPTAIPGTGLTSLPISITDIETNGFEATLPVFHYYLKGVEVPDAVFTGTESVRLPAKENFVSRCFPNPCNGNTSLIVTLTKPAAIEISLSTISGQEVYSYNHGIMPEGNNTLKIEGEILKKGIYLCSVMVNGVRSTQKLIVQF